MPLASAAKPGLFLMLATFLRFLARFREHHPFDPSVFGFRFIVCGENTTVSTSLSWWLAKELLVSIQVRDPLIPVAGVAVEHLPMSNDATFDFIQPDFAAILNRFANLS